MATDSSLRLDTSKAGMGGVDKERANKIILEMSKDSKYFAMQQRRDAVVQGRIQDLLRRRDALPKHPPLASVHEVERLRHSLLAQLDLSRSWVHVDMDCFYAAVEMRDNPRLRDVPLGIGGSSMLCTTNYLARRFGCRSAMPGFIAKKLCPQLVIVPSNFKLYRAVSKQVQAIVLEYDPHAEMNSLDEANLDISDFLAAHPGRTAPDVAAEIRRRIFEETALTASAGVACNRLLSKICSDINKPNGQFVLASTPDAVREFVSKLSVGRVPGIGSVCEQLLQALHVTTCQEILDNAPLLHQLFSPKTFTFFLKAALGVGLAQRDLANLRERRSLSHERTFHDTNNAEALHKVCSTLVDITFERWRDKRLPAFKTVTLKLKTDKFRVLSRSASPSVPVTRKEVLSQLCHKLLDSELAANKGNGVTFRLLGVRASGFAKPIADGTPSVVALLERHNSARKATARRFPAHQEDAKKEEKREGEEEHRSDSEGSEVDEEEAVCPVCLRLQPGAPALAAHLEACQPQHNSNRGEVEGEEQQGVQGEGWPNADKEGAESRVHSPSQRAECPVCGRVFCFVSGEWLEGHVQRCIDERMQRPERHHSPSPALQPTPTPPPPPRPPTTPCTERREHNKRQARTLEAFFSRKRPRDK